MSHIVRCSQCQRQLRLPDPLPPNKGKCPVCGFAFHAHQDPDTGVVYVVQAEESAKTFWGRLWHKLRKRGGRQESWVKEQVSGEGLDLEFQTARPTLHRRITRWLGIQLRRLLLVSLLICMVGGAWLYYLFTTLPNLDQLNKAHNNLQLIVDKKGDLLRFRQAIFNLQVGFEDMPPHLIDALLTMEDRRFFSHFGVDPMGIGRAVFQRLTGTGKSGGSTLTQQLAKNLFLSMDRSLLRKVKEALLALKIEQYYSKEEILERYLNRVHFGNGVNGVETAARRYFHKRAKDLTLYEAALLVGSLPRPNTWNYQDNPNQAGKRADLVIREMRTQGKLSGKVLTRVRMGERQWRKADYIFLLDAMRQEILEKVGNKDGRLHVISTIDPEMQVYAELSLREAVDKKGGARHVNEGALVALDPGGAVKAMVGYVDRSQSTMNHATQAKRQLGSLFKPFVFLAALNNGWNPTSTISGGRLNIDGWSPRNVNNRYPSRVTLTKALAFSINTAAVHLQETIGRSEVMALARRLNLEARLPDKPALALGVGEGTLMDITRAYTVFANGGYPVHPRLVVGVRTRTGRILYWHKPAPPPARLVEKPKVEQLNRMLAEVVKVGTGRQAKIPSYRCAGKTGTTQDNRDAWFVGFTGHLSAGVWLGNRDNSPMIGISGSNLPARIWRRFMTNTHYGLDFDGTPPPGL